MKLIVLMRNYIDVKRCKMQCKFKKKDIEFVGDLTETGYCSFIFKFYDEVAKCLIFLKYFFIGLK